MKLIVLAVCVVFALITVANAEFYKCLNSKGIVIITDTLLPDAKCESRGGGNESKPGERQHIRTVQASGRTGLTQQDEIKLDGLYNRAISESEGDSYSVGTRSNFLCLAEVISIVKSKGESINPRFWSLAEDAIENRQYSVGRRLNIIQRASSIQSVNTSNISSCNSAMLHSMPKR